MLNKIIKAFLENGAIVLKIKVKTGTVKTEISGKMADGTLKMGVKAVPEKGKANLEIIKYISKVFKTDKENVKIISGAKSSKKLIKISKK